MNLEESIKARGQLMPGIVQRLGPHRYKMIDGQQRMDALIAKGEKTFIAYVLVEYFNMLTKEVELIPENNKNQWQEIPIIQIRKR